MRVVVRVLNGTPVRCSVKTFFKWTAVAVGATVGTAIIYRMVETTRVRLEQGLARVERIAEDAQAAVARTEQALGQTAQTARDIRQTIS